MNTNTLSALAEPNRMRIIELLRENPYPVGEIARRLELRQPQVSKHLRVLSEAGLVELRPVAQQHIFALRPGPFRELGGWLESFRATWEARLDTLDETLQELKREAGQDQP
ncbi:MAG TPA: metalloregulator ArsR/SmtB family transcription factor [Anaerolineales bacterium]|jgi:DNA-binding transcriptional ArsR family regulator